MPEYDAKTPYRTPKMLPSKNSILVSVDEIWLKGLNRIHYMRMLGRQISQATQHTAGVEVQREGAKWFVDFLNLAPSEVIHKLSRLPGIHSLDIGWSLSNDLNTIADTAIQYLKDLPDPFTFKVLTKRIDKSYPMTSEQISERVGGLIKCSLPHLKVKLKLPETTLRVHFLKTKAHLSGSRVMGPGGLPTSTNGHLLTLLSGGFDSPVAAHMMSCRGTLMSYAFFHSYPFVGNEVIDKIKNIVRILSQSQDQSNLWIVPFGSIQNRIAQSVKPNYRTVFFRIAMVRAAELLAQKIQAGALVTGDCLGQVSSQTLENLSLVDQLSKLSILRPLIGLKKSQILDFARQIGTHDLSIIDCADSCQLFSARHPILRPYLPYVHRELERLHLQEPLREIVENLVPIRFFQRP